MVRLSDLEGVEQFSASRVVLKLARSWLPSGDISNSLGASDDHHPSRRRLDLDPRIRERTAEEGWQHV